MCDAPDAPCELFGVDPTSATHGDRDPEASEAREPSPGVALCLSGGGYRAMLFHAGALWRLNELGWLLQLDRVSSVSGGSITAGVLALAWRRLAFSGEVASNFATEVVHPVRRLARQSIDVQSVLLGLVTWDSIAERVVKAYDRHLFHGATLQDLPDKPRIVINASNVQSGALWRFSKPFIRDYRVGKIPSPRLPLAQAVAASSAFPPFLSPLVLKLRHEDYETGSGDDLQRPPFTTRPTLTDGGVYDNLGLETAWKRYRTILVSNGGGKMAPQERPKTEWLRHTRRVLDLVDSQVRALRQRQILGAFKQQRSGSAWRDGAYWGIRTDLTTYGLPDALPCPHDATMRLAEVATRLAKMDERLQERLINWGYAVCDAAMRRYVVTGAAPPPKFPYAAAGVG